MALIHREFIIRWNSASVADLIRVIEDFCATSESYIYLIKETDEYEKGINAFACMVADTASGAGPALAFASSDNRTLQLTNIVPDKVSEIGIKEYNDLLDRFAEHFKMFCKKRKIGVRILRTSDELTLNAVIPGEKTRAYFSRYLAFHPTSYHPLDIRRLDVFICAAFRYSHKMLDLHGLRRYLIEVLKWDEKDASWCCDRVSILQENRRF